MLAVTLVVMTLFVAFANGSNDVSKGIATLAGSGVSNYRTAVLWGAIWTVAGSLSAAFATQALVATFSGKGILVRPTTSQAFLLSVAVGAIGFLIIATLTGMPVSTTHSLAGGLIGAAFVDAATGGIVWRSIASRIALPLAASPVMSLVLLIALLPVLRRLTRHFDRYCICVEQEARDVVTPDGVAFRQVAAPVEVGSIESCSTAVARVSAIDLLHWISAGATSFFRGLNDTPKIVALGIAAAAAIGISTISSYALVALAMGAGSFIAGLRVTETLAEKVTPITPANGFAANLVTALLVGVASRFGLPVSTTHVSTGAITGVGISRGGHEVRWKMVGEMLFAWIITLPVSAVIAAVVYRVIA